MTEIEFGIISLIHRAIQDERSVFWGVIVYAIVRKKNRINVCLIMNGTRNRAV
jgi:hypothetical protein